MRSHQVAVHPASAELAQVEQLAFKLAQVAVDPVAAPPAVVEMVINRIIDNAAVAVAALERRPVANARSQALCHARSQRGATVFGLPHEQLFAPEWAAWANGTAVRELDFHDTFLAADYSHPGDNIPPLLATAQALGKNGRQLAQAIATAYEVQVQLVKGICLHRWKKDHIAHLGIASVAGLANLLEVDVETAFQAMGQVLHVTFATRQSRKGEISSWKAYAPAFGGKMAIEAMDRAMRGEKSPAPIYEGEDSVIAWMLGGPQDSYTVELPEPGEARVGILQTYTKEHSAEYQSQALIDLAFKLGGQLSSQELEAVDSITIHTSHHTHYVIGTGANDPQKMDPHASRETLDHSIMYIFAVALQDGKWHHGESYAPERACRADTVRLWHKISTQEDPYWTERYHAVDPKVKAFGGRVVIVFKDGTVKEDQLALANAHPWGARPFIRENYVAKFKQLTEDVIAPAESQRFLQLAQNLPELAAGQLLALNVEVSEARMPCARQRDQRGIF